MSSATPLDTDSNTEKPLRKRLAVALTQGLSPRFLVAGLPIAVALADAPRLPRLAWALVNVIACSGIPMLAIERAQRAGQVTSGHHITKRSERIGPLSVAVLSVAGGLLALHLGHAPRDLIVLAWAMFAGLVTALTITTVWKISFHVAVAAASVLILADIYGPWLYASAALAAAVAWSRVELDEHTVAQVCAGAVLGAVVSGGLFLALA